MEPTNTIKPWQWIVSILVVIIIIALAAYMFIGGKGGSSYDSTTGGNSTSGATAGDTNSPNRVVVSNQYPGNIVYLSSVQIADSGFVAIAKDTSGTPASFIGSQFFNSSSQPGTINLSEKTVEGATYYAVLYNDTNGDRKFDPAVDMPVKDSAGKVIMQSFKATVNLPEDKG